MADIGGEFAIDQAVCVYPGTDNQKHGVVVEDFGEMAGQSVDIGGTNIVGAARRWAVRLDTGELVFVDSHQLARE
jgi:hypothetical protein